jgi:hypothetical protein
MKHVTLHWTEIRYCEFPDDAPVHDENALLEWIHQHPDAQGDLEYFTVKAESDLIQTLLFNNSNERQPVRRSRHRYPYYAVLRV